LTPANPAGKPQPREARLAWITDAAACAYFAWLFGFHWRNVGAFGQMYEGLGAELPLLTRFVVGQGTWLFPLLFAVFAGAAVGKERLIADKRFSVMVTFLLTIVAQFVAQALVTAYYLPLFDLIGKLS
jgi:type II secretory pathway component PulF